MKVKKFCILLLSLLLIISCSLSPFEKDTSYRDTEQTVVTEDSSLFIENESNNTYIFETNDTTYLTSNGYTLWGITDTNTSNTFNNISVSICKNSGRTEAGYGVVFCSQEVDGNDFMLVVLINANGLYTVGKVVNGVFSHINNGWKSSNYINKGLGIQNILLISYDTVNNKFLLKINGYSITDFSVSEEINFINSKSGYAVVIANNENFPNNSVKVTFEKIN